MPPGITTLPVASTVRVASVRLPAAVGYATPDDHEGHNCRYTPVFCSVIVMNGTATITRAFPCAAVC